MSDCNESEIAKESKLASHGCDSPLLSVGAFADARNCPFLTENVGHDEPDVNRTELQQ